MLKLLKKKLIERNGESLAEVMIAVLIIAVGLVLLSSLIMAASHMMEQGQERMDAIYEGSNAMESQLGEVSQTGQQMTVKTGTATYYTNVDIYENEESGLKTYIKSTQ